MEKKLFDYAIGNPPYHESQNLTSDNPVYHILMDAAYKVSSKAEFITPARFLFNAGKTPKDWNQKMLQDEHFKVQTYEPNASKIFPNTEIKGGVAITYRDETKNYGAIGIFTKYEELNLILKKVVRTDFLPINNIIYLQNKWNLQELYKEHPECQKQIGSNGKERRLTTSIFSTLDIFRDTEKEGDVRILGLIKNNRIYKYIPKKYLDQNSNINSYKVILPKVNGIGAFGETLATLLIASPGTGFTQSFISIGTFKTENEANSALKYIKSKFARAMLNVLKITQDNNSDVWKYVPLQDFTSNSDIDWSKSIHEIDLQLYKKYGLTNEEIQFIETNVKEMV